jgi:hypothetical protein
MSNSMIITQDGQAQVALALANGTAITIAEIAVGSAQYTPSGTEAALTQEVYRMPVIAKGTSANGLQSYFMGEIGVADGPFVLNEIGLFDTAGNLLFIGELPSINKPDPQISAMSLGIRVHVLTAHFQTAVVNIVPSNALVPGQRRVNAGLGLAGGGDLMADVTLDLDIGELPAMASSDVDHATDALAVLDANDGGTAANPIPAHKSLTLHALSEAVVASQPFEDAIGASVSLDGPGVVFPGSTNLYQITDFSAFATYQVQSSVGTATLTGDQITLTIGANVGAATMQMTVTRDGRDTLFDIAIGAASVATPTLTNPAHQSTDIGEMPILRTTPFASFPSNAFSHTATTWEVATDAQFANIVGQSVTSTQDLTEFVFPSALLTTSTVYFARATHIGFDGTNQTNSPWSATVRFTTAASFYLANERAIVAPSPDAQAMSGDGNTIIIGETSGRPAPGRTARGIAKMYRRQGAGFVLDATLVPPEYDDPTGYLFSANTQVYVQLYGRSVALSEDGQMAVVGSRNNAFLWRRQGGFWTYFGQLTFSNPPVMGTFFYAHDIAISDNNQRVAILSSFMTTSGAAISNEPRVHIFDLQSNAFVHTGTIVLAVRSLNAGWKVRVSGNKVFFTSETFAEIWEETNGTWSRLQDVLATAPGPLGESLAISDNGSVVAITGRDTSNGIFIFHENSTTGQYDLFSNIGPIDSFGTLYPVKSVILSDDGTQLLCGVDDGTTDRVFLMREVGGIWFEETEIIPSQQINDFGDLVDLNGSGATALISGRVFE